MWNVSGLSKNTYPQKGDFKPSSPLYAGIYRTYVFYVYTLKILPINLVVHMANRKHKSCSLLYELTCTSENCNFFKKKLTFKKLIYFNCLLWDVTTLKSTRKIISNIPFIICFTYHTSKFKLSLMKVE